MHWLEKWRQKNAVTRLQLARAADCSAQLIALIEETGTITQKDIAGRIADCTGATQREYRQLVHEKHRNAWTPDPERTRRAAAGLKRASKGIKSAAEAAPATKTKTAPVRMTEDKPKEAKTHGWVRITKRSRAIYMINAECKPVAKFASLTEAMAATGNCASNIQSRCEEQVVSKEFTAQGYTFRYADDWDEGRVDMDRMREAAEKLNSRRTMGVVFVGNRLMLSYEGKTGTVAEWSKILGLSQSTIRERIRAGLPIESILRKRKEEKHS